MYYLDTPPVDYREIKVGRMAVLKEIRPPIREHIVTIVKIEILPEYHNVGLFEDWTSLYCTIRDSTGEESTTTGLNFTKILSPWEEQKVKAIGADAYYNSFLQKES